MKQGYMSKSKSDKWQTPNDFYEKLNSEFKFNYDPCPIDWKEGNEDGLLTEWGSSTFCNPPYSKVSLWIQKAYEEFLKGKTVVMLINSITDTIAFHKYIYGKAEIRFIKGRIKFVNYSDPTKSAPSPKPSMLVIFKH